MVMAWTAGIKLMPTWQEPCRNRGVLNPEAGILLLVTENDDTKVTGQSPFFSIWDILTSL